MHEAEQGVWVLISLLELADTILALFHLTPCQFIILLLCPPQVAGQLLPVLVRRRSLCRQLVQLASWQELAGAFATRQPGLITQLQQRLHRSLAQVGDRAIGLWGVRC